MVLSVVIRGIEDIQVYRAHILNREAACQGGTEGLGDVTPAFGRWTG